MLVLFGGFIMAEKKNVKEVEKKAEEKKQAVQCFINGLSPNMVKDAAKLENGKVVKDDKGNIVTDDKYKNVVIFDVDETMYSFRVPKGAVKNAQKSNNLNVVLYEIEGKTLNVAVKPKGAEKPEYKQMAPSELAEIQEAKHLSRMKDPSKIVWLNGIDVTENSKAFYPTKDGKKAKLIVRMPNALGDDVTRKVDFYPSLQHYVDVKDKDGNVIEGKKHLKLMSDSMYSGRCEPGYEKVEFTGQQIADAWDIQRQEARKYAQEHAAEAVAEEEVVEVAEVEDELEA
jgi:hypothetical protein